MGVLGRADCHRGEVQGGDGVWGDGGGYGGVNPVTVGLADYMSRCYQGEAEYDDPTSLSDLSLGERTIYSTRNVFLSS